MPDMIINGKRAIVSVTFVSDSPYESFPKDRCFMFGCEKKRFSGDTICLQHRNEKEIREFNQAISR